MSTLHSQLHTLAAHVRDPAHNAGPKDIEERRLRVYRELVFNNVQGLLTGSFPVLRKTLREREWQTLLRDFLIHHRSETPLFTRLGLEFVAFLEAHANPARPWLAELAHYEWAELGLQLCDAATPPHDPQGDLLVGVPVLSPLAWPLAYQWPVHTLGPDYQPVDSPAEPTLLLLHRQADGRVQFSQLSPLLYRLLTLLEANTQHTGQQLLQALVAEAGQPDFNAFLADVRPMLARLQASGVLLGTRIG